MRYAEPSRLSLWHSSAFIAGIGPAAPQTSAGSSGPSVLGSTASLQPMVASLPGKI